MKTKTLIASLVLAGFAATSQAGMFTFLENGSNVDLGNSSTFVSGGISLTAYGYGPAGAVHLYAKDLGVGDEQGLGLVNDPAGQNEITAGSFIQLRLPTSPATVLTLALIESITGSAGGLEGAQIYWSTTLGSLGAAISPILIGDGSGNASFSIPSGLGAGYLGITATSGNVLLGSVTYGAPDGGSSLILLGSALSAAGLIRRKLMA